MGRGHVGSTRGDRATGTGLAAAVPVVPSRGNAGRTPPRAGTELAAARHAHVGVAVLGQHGNDLLELLAAADVALYRAKDAGRDQGRLYARAGERRGSRGRVRLSGRVPVG